MVEFQIQIMYNWISPNKTHLSIDFLSFFLSLHFSLFLILLVCKTPDVWCVCYMNCMLPLAQGTIGFKYSLTYEETLHAARHMWRDMSVCVTGMLMCRALTTILWPGFKEVLVWEVVFVLCGPEMEWGVRGPEAGGERMWMGFMWCVRCFYSQ